MNQEYYIQIMGRDAGPFTLEEVYQMIRQKDIHGTTLVRKEDTFAPADRYPELSILLECLVKKTATATTEEQGTEPWALTSVLRIFRVYTYLLATILLLAAPIQFEQETNEPIRGICLFLLGISSLIAARLCKLHPRTAFCLYIAVSLPLYAMTFIYPEEFGYSLNILDVVTTLLDVFLIGYYLRYREQLTW